MAEDTDPTALEMLDHEVDALREASRYRGWFRLE